MNCGWKGRGRGAGKSVTSSKIIKLVSGGAGVCILSSCCFLLPTQLLSWCVTVPLPPHSVSTDDGLMIPPITQSIGDEDQRKDGREKEEAEMQKDKCKIQKK